MEIEKRDWEEDFDYACRLEAPVLWASWDILPSGRIGIWCQTTEDMEKIQERLEARGYRVVAPDWDKEDFDFWWTLKEKFGSVPDLIVEVELEVNEE